MSDLSAPLAVLLSLLLLPLAGCSANRDEGQSGTASSKASAEDSAGAPAKRVRKATFSLSPGGIQTLVAALGDPWTDGFSSVRKGFLPDRSTIRTAYLRAGGAVTIDTDRAGRVTSFELQSGRGAQCGDADYLEPGLERLVYGLGSPSLYVEDMKALESAWASASRKEVRTPTTEIEASSDGCIYTLGFRARASR